MAEMSKDEIQAGINSLGKLVWEAEALVERLKEVLDEAHKLGAGVAAGAGFEVPVPQQGDITPKSGGGGK